MAENKESSAKNWLFRLNETLAHKSFTTMVVTLWAIWYASRKAVHDGIFQSLMHTSSFVTSYITSCSNWRSLMSAMYK